MHKARTRVFRDTEKLHEMIELRLHEWSLSQLSRRYNVHHTSILHWCQEFGLTGSRFSHTKKSADEKSRIIIMSVHLGILPPNPQHKSEISQKENESYYMDEFGEKILKDRPYEYYVKSRKSRHSIRVQDTHNNWYEIA